MRVYIKPAIYILLILSCVIQVGCFNGGATQPPIDSGGDPPPQQKFTATYSFADGGVILDWVLLSESNIIQYRIIRYEITDNLDPLMDISIGTIKSTPDIPPIVDKYVKPGYKYQYHLNAFDAEGQVCAALSSNEVEIPI